MNTNEKKTAPAGNEPEMAVMIAGVTFRNPVFTCSGCYGAGQEYSEFIDLSKLGAVTAKGIADVPWEGNPTPRVCEIPSGMMNCIGLQNPGVKVFKERDLPFLREQNTGVIVNVVGHEEDEYLRVIDALQDEEGIDLLEINISCPNVNGITDLQDVAYLSDFMDKLLDNRMAMDNYKPVLVKISPDLPREQLDDLLDYCLRSGVDGVVAGNTTKSRDKLTLSSAQIEKIGPGGLSGAPLFRNNLALVSYVHEKTKGRLPIIGVGGIMSPEDAESMIEAGADLVEIYTGFIYEGPDLVKKIKQSLDTQKDIKQ